MQNNNHPIPLRSMTNTHLHSEKYNNVNFIFETTKTINIAREAVLVTKWIFFILSNWCIYHKSYHLKATRAIYRETRQLAKIKNQKKIENLWFSIFFKKTVLKTTNIQVFKNSTLHRKISRLDGGGLLQKLSVTISSNIHCTITQNHCW